MVAEVIPCLRVTELRDLKRLKTQNVASIASVNGTGNVTITGVAPAAVGTATISKWLKLTVGTTEWFIPMWK